MLLPLPWQRRLQGVEGRWTSAATQPGCQAFWRLSALHPFLLYPFQFPLRTTPLLLSVNHTSTAPPVENLTPKTPHVDHQVSQQSEPSNLGLMLPSASVRPRGHRVNTNSTPLQSEVRVCMATPQKRHHSFPLDLGLEAAMLSWLGHHTEMFSGSCALLEKNPSLLSKES